MSMVQPWNHTTIKIGSSITIVFLPQTKMKHYIHNQILVSTSAHLNYISTAYPHDPCTFSLLCYHRSHISKVLGTLILIICTLHISYSLYMCTFSYYILNTCYETNSKNRRKERSTPYK